MEKKKLLVDTDIGDDIDDLLALDLLFCLEEAELVGITTVFKNTNLRARMTAKVLELAGRKLPVYAGCGTPIGGDFKVSTAERFLQYTEDLNENRYAPVNDAEGARGDEAIKFILESVRRYGKELTILGIGPLTNIALAIRREPEVMKSVGRIVIMGGAYYMAYREWNIVCDIEAAKTVFESGVPLECVGYDVTKKVSLCYAKQRFIHAGGFNGLAAYSAEMAVRWNRETKRCITLHDPLTVYYALHPEILLMEETQVYLETGGSVGRGVTFNLKQMNDVAEHRYVGRTVKCAKDCLWKDFVDLFMHKVFHYRAEEILC